MTTQDKKVQPDSEQAAAHLRKEAEDILQRKADSLPGQPEAMSPEELQEKLHDLQVHQVELEMQNSELRRAQAELEAARKRSFELYDLAPVGYCTLSEAGLILNANMTVSTLLEVSKRVLLKQPLTRFICEEDQDIYYMHRNRLFTTGEPQVCELRMVKNTGVSCWVLLSANIAKAESGTTICRIVLSDITERKRIEKEKTELEAQLHQDQKFNAIGRLAGGVAHEFNNKLAIILGFVEIVMDKIGTSDPIYGDMVEIRNAAQHSAILTRQLLAFSRRQPVVPKVLVLNDTVTGFLHMLRRLIGENISLSWLPQADLWPVKIDPSQLDQILVNLCVNARDAISGTGTITTTAENIIMDDVACATLPGIDPGEYVLLMVADSGCGMDEDTLGKIFEPFFTTKDVDKGTGLGLATVYGVVKQNGGFVYAESELGSGSIFKIFLPRYKGETMDEEVPGEAPSERAQQNTGTILLVEDEPVILKLARRMLQSLGYIVLAANTPTEAIHLAREFGGEINLLVTDMIMPEMNGRKLASEIVPFFPQLKVLYMSGYTADIILSRETIEASICFVQKPFSKNELASQVRKALAS